MFSTVLFPPSPVPPVHLKGRDVLYMHYFYKLIYANWNAVHFMQSSITFLFLCRTLTCVFVATRRMGMSTP